MAVTLDGTSVFVAGHAGMVGSALLRRLAREPVSVITAPRRDLDLRDRAAVLAFLRRTRPDVVIVAAARVGGIAANDAAPATFLAENLMIATSLITAAHEADIQDLLFLGSSCIYPRDAPQPVTEEMLLTGPLEATNEGYAIAKIAGLKLCQAYRRQFGRDYIACQPSNLYGPHDNFDLASAHVLPALLRKAHAAKRDGAAALTVWGTGTPRREFLHVDDLADACIFQLRHYSGDLPLNVGWGADLSIAEAAAHVAETVGFDGPIVFDPTKPDGTPRKLLDTTRLTALGWVPTIDLRTGLKHTYAWFLAHERELRGGNRV